jgi:hypothetical protein
MTASSTQASHTGFASSNVERLGTITTTTTAVNISIPYTFGTKETLNSDGTLDSASASAEIVLWQGNGPVSEVNIDFAGLDVPGETSGSGILTLNAQQLTPGPHVFFIDGEADAKAVFLPEPSTIAMLCTGLLALIGFSLLRGLTSTWS